MDDGDYLYFDALVEQFYASDASGNNNAASSADAQQPHQGQENFRVEQDQQSQQHQSPPPQRNRQLQLHGHGQDQHHYRQHLEQQQHISANTNIQPFPDLSGQMSIDDMDPESLQSVLAFPYDPDLDEQTYQSLGLSPGPAVSTNSTYTPIPTTAPAPALAPAPVPAPTPASALVAAVAPTAQQTPHWGRNTQPPALGYGYGAGTSTPTATTDFKPQFNQLHRGQLYSFINYTLTPTHQQERSSSDSTVFVGHQHNNSASMGNAAKSPSVNPFQTDARTPARHITAIPAPAYGSDPVTGLMWHTDDALSLGSFSPQENENVDEDLSDGQSADGEHDLMEDNESDASNAQDLEGAEEDEDDTEDDQHGDNAARYTAPGVYGKYGGFFRNADEARRHLSHAQWTPPIPDNTIPTTDDDIKRYHRRLCLAVVNMQNIQDRPTSQHRPFFEEKRHTQINIEATCWILLQGILDLHHHGYSGPTARSSQQDRNLSCAERIEATVKLLKEWKSTCTLVMKEATDRIVVGPIKLYKQNETNKSSSRDKSIRLRHSSGHEDDIARNRRYEKNLKDRNHHRLPFRVAKAGLEPGSGGGDGHSNNGDAGQVAEDLPSES